jgi:hypothetical protein
MRSLVSLAALSVTLAAVPAASFAQSVNTAWQPNVVPLTWSAARAETDVQLQQMARAGFSATMAGNQNYPQAMQRALERVKNRCPTARAKRRWRWKRAPPAPRAAAIRCRRSS